MIDRRLYEIEIGESKPEHNRKIKDLYHPKIEANVCLYVHELMRSTWNTKFNLKRMLLDVIGARLNFHSIKID